MDDEEEGIVVPFAKPVVTNDNPNVGEQVNPLRLPRDYIITDIDNYEWFGTGFLVFTPEHVAVMKMLDGGGAVPSVVLPLGRVKAAELYEEDEV